jgi:hypothetical protein
MSREVERQRLKNLLVYHRKHRRPRLVTHLQRTLDEMPIGGILPDEPRNLVAHCGAWHPVVTLPLVLPCCGWVLEEQAAQP